MLDKRKIAQFKMEGDQITISNKDLNLRFNYSSVTTLCINNEMDESAREMEVSLKKLKRHESYLANYLRIKLSVHGVDFIFVVSRAEGEPLALHVENQFRQMMLSAECVPGSLADESKKIFEDDDPNEAAYPVYFHAYTGFGEAVTE